MNLADAVQQKNIPADIGDDDPIDIEIPVVIRTTRKGIGPAVQALKREMGLQFHNSYILDGRIVVRPPQTIKNLNDQPRER